VPRRERAPQLRPALAPDDLRHAAYAPSTAAGRRALLAQVKAGCEDRPGTYRMLGATGLVLYVGKAKRLRTRLLGYFRSAQKNRRRDKQARILRHAHGLAWEYAPSEFAALRPRAAAHQAAPAALQRADEHRRAAARAGSPSPAGPVAALRVELRTDAPEAAVLYGPFRRLHQLADAARGPREATGRARLRVRHAGGGRLGARRLPARRARRLRLPGTAAGRVGRGLRRARGRGARLPRRPHPPAGRDAAGAHARGQRRLAVRARAALRERLLALEWLAGRLERFHAGADRLSFIYRPLGDDAGDGRARVYLVRRGTVRAELPAPAGADDEAALARLARRVFTAPDPADLPTHDLDEFYLVASWFRRHPEELARTEAPPGPDPPR
jgi:hypothetical protein